MECLTPDFSGDAERVALVARSGLDVFAHNVETVEALTPFVRDRRAKYRQSLSVLELAKSSKPGLVRTSFVVSSSLHFSSLPTCR